MDLRGRRLPAHLARRVGSFVAPLTPRERGSIVHAYYRRLTSEDPAERKAAALAWNAFGRIASHLVADPETPAEEDIEREIALARIEAHYFVNDSFLATDDQLLRDAWRLRASQGSSSRDATTSSVRCSPRGSSRPAWPEARLVVVPAAGHAADEPGITAALVEATESFKASATP